MLAYVENIYFSLTSVCVRVSWAEYHGYPTYFSHYARARKGVRGETETKTTGEATKFDVSHSICCVEKINKCVAIKFVVFMAFMLI